VQQTPAFEDSWAELLAEIDRFVGLTPRSDVNDAFHKQRVAEFEAKAIAGI
jgi:hypothetical protein